MGKDTRTGQQHLLSLRKKDIQQDLGIQSSLERHLLFLKVFGSLNPSQYSP
jgi:hypothetical protein